MSGKEVFHGLRDGEFDIQQPAIAEHHDEEAQFPACATDRNCAKLTPVDLCGFSGGERKRNEVLQMALLEPAIAFLDETDSGLDIDALRIVARGVRTVRDENPLMGVVVVTHYVKLLEEIEPDQVHILVDGRIVHTANAELAQQIELDGYDAWRAVTT